MSAQAARSGPGRRAVVRWAWRLFRREWRQQLLILALVTVAVAAAVAGASTAVNAGSAGNGGFGTAGAMLRLDGTRPEVAKATVAAARQRFGPLEVIGHTSVSVPGSAERLDLRAQDPHGLYGHSMLALRQGRYPTTAGEVALTGGAIDLLSAGLGQRVVLGGVERTIVGRVENPDNLNDEFALVAADENTPADTLAVLLKSGHRQVDGPTPTGEPGFLVMIRGSDKAGVVASVLVATTLAMALVCLVAAAGFVVVAQRRQRQLGLLAAIGATQRHLRLVMLANGTIVGVTAALAGGALGILGWIAAAPAVEVAAAHRINRLDLPWDLVGECMLLAVVVATLAAWWPARSMARLPVMAALSGRPAHPSPVHRSLALAVGLVALGAGGIASARTTGDHVRPLILIAGVLAVVVGMVFASPAAIRTLGAPAGRLPLPTRLALRDLVRYQARAAAALAAITLVLGISDATIVVAKAAEYRTDEGNLSSRQLVIRVGDARTAPDPDLSPTDRAELDGAAARIGSVLVDPTLLTLDVAMNPSPAPRGADREPVSVGISFNNGFRGLGFPYVATPSLLRRYGIDPATIGATTDLLTALPGNVGLFDPTVRPNPGDPPTVSQRVDLSTFASAPTSLVTDNAMRRHGWVPARAGWLLESSTPLTKAQVSAARAAAGAVGLTVEARSSQNGLSALRTVTTTVGGLLALAIVGMTIGLIRSEAGRDLRTLTATGASAGTRRTITASTAGSLALLGVVLGAVGAYIALVAAYHADLARLAAPPIAHLLLLAVALPLIATCAAWLLSGRELRTFARQALD